MRIFFGLIAGVQSGLVDRFLLSADDYSDSGCLPALEARANKYEVKYVTFQNRTEGAAPNEAAGADWQVQGSPPSLN